MFVHKTKKLHVAMSISVGSYLIILYKQTVDPDQAALPRAVWFGSALFTKVLKGVSMR